MKNYLLALKNLLIKKKEANPREMSNVTVDNNEKDDNSETNYEEILGLQSSSYELTRVLKANTNAFEISNNLIYFYPPNDGMPRCPFEFYSDGKMVIDNRMAFIQITNLDDILLEMTNIMEKALDNYVIINPYSFMLELTGDIHGYYHGTAKLVLSDKAIKNKDVLECDLDDARAYFINVFLDHFIGWNFGLSVNRSSKLREALERLNNKVIDLGIREDAGPGFEVYGVDEVAYDGLQHYYLPISKNKKLIK